MVGGAPFEFSWGYYFNLHKFVNCKELLNFEPILLIQVVVLALCTDRNEKCYLHVIVEQASANGSSAAD